MTTWTDNPLVQRAIRLADEAGDPSPLRIMEELLGLMNALEERFPGVPFGEILADKAAIPGRDTARIRRTLRKNGACEDDITLVAPLMTDREIVRRKYTATSDPYAEHRSHYAGVLPPDEGRL